MGPASQWCSAINCNNNRKKNPDFSFFSVPSKDQERAKKWIINSRRDDLLKKDIKYLTANICFCQVHFEPHMFMNANAPKKRLVWNAVPTLFDVPNPPKLAKIQRKEPFARSAPSLQSGNVHAKANETQAYIQRVRERKKKERELRQLLKSSSAMSKAKKLLKAKNNALYYLRKTKVKRELSSQGNKVDTILQAVTPLLTKDEMTILKERLESKGKSRKGREYSTDYKHLVIRISFKSTKTYKYLSKRLNLPPKSTISRWMSKIQFRDGLDDNLFALLALRVKEIEQADRYACLLMDEMSLKEGLDYDHGRDKVVGVTKRKDGSYAYPSNVLTFMLTGIRRKWKQVISYNFCEHTLPADQVYNIFVQILAKVEQSGITVVNVTADQGSNFSALFGKLKVSEATPFFLLNGRKVFVTPDPPHLLKSARNALLDHTIVTPEGRASWKHISTMFKWDCKQTARLAPKLTVDHVEPPPFYGKMSVSRATQVLSHTVSCALKACVNIEVLPPEALATSTYCEIFNQIFDVLNSSRSNGATPFKSALKPSNDKVLIFIPKAIQWLKALEIMGKDGKTVTSKFRFLQGIILALASVQQQMSQMCTNLGFDFLLTRRLCQDPLENFFGIIRGRNGYNSNPTCLEFSRACKVVLCD